jgi:hypothetical protein
MTVLYKNAALTVTAGDKNIGTDGLLDAGHPEDETSVA